MILDLVSWKGYGPEHNTWEPEAHVYARPTLQPMLAMTFPLGHMRTKFERSIGTVNRKTTPSNKKRENAVVHPPPHLPRLLLHPDVKARRLTLPLPRAPEFRNLKSKLREMTRWTNFRMLRLTWMGSISTRTSWIGRILWTVSIRLRRGMMGS